MEEYQETFRLSPGFPNQNCSLKVRHPSRGDIMEEYQETFRLSPGFLVASGKPLV